MSIFQDAHVVVFLADYVGIDTSSKINALGAGFTLSGWQNGVAAPQHVAVMVDVPGKYVGQEFALTLELRDETADRAVQVPGQSGQLEALRMQQVARVEPPVAAPGIYLPQAMFSRTQVVLGFPTGISLAPSNFYAWRVEIDGQTRKDWRAPFYVPGPPPGPVFGGPTGPSDIPGMPPPGSA